MRSSLVALLLPLVALLLPLVALPLALPLGCSSYVTSEPRSLYADATVERIEVRGFEVGEAAVPPGATRLARHEVVRALEERGYRIEGPAASQAPDAVLEGRLYRFEHRVGGELGVSRPASVGLELSLRRASDGALLWTGTYDETQSPASENLGDVRLWPERGWRWLTAEQLLRYGADHLAEALDER